VRAAGRGELRRGRRVHAVKLVEGHDVATQRDVMRLSGAGAWRRAVLCPARTVDRADPEQFAAAAERVAVFEVRAAGARLSAGAAPSR
jgi:hypothetical protein